ncbi:hypothetical protein B1757_02290 [Acidithiobacillus marinus]|uniref:Tyr recombinase domain-containing protein n=1 Tax=Acidithiobacillus marinus TaxID=187490 RepID=A0A2I1DPN3_9PROT|nr:phage integrase Arm DNA-binding domain-containing protein [Acidithiobacillus marinus]PKY11812.1 hypothetical protein B1757_02290 [Acidithiobacillus marinus]
MSPRPRSTSKKLPPNLSQQVRGNKIYFSYRNPLNGKRAGFGTNKDKAISAAIALNAHLAKQLQDQESQQLISRVITSESHGTIGDFLTIFEEQILPARRSKKGFGLSEKTLQDYHWILGTIRQELGHFRWDVITLQHVAHFLDKRPPRSSNIHRTILAQVWRHAIAKGITGPGNLPEMTIPKTHVVERTSLTLEGFQKIYAIAEPWFQNALDLALHTLQRREDLVLYRFDAIQIENGIPYLPVRQKKVEHSSDAGRLLLPIGEDLQEIIDRCRDKILSPLMIHRNPKKKRREYLDKKEHWTTVYPVQLTREFSKLRDRCGFYSKTPQEKRPTFHEIRALGADLYRQAGWPDDSIQKLLGHTSEKMTKHYLDKHQEPWIVTDTVGLPKRVCRK